jgi:hypothetical protein
VCTPTLETRHSIPAFSFVSRDTLLPPAIHSSSSIHGVMEPVGWSNKPLLESFCGWAQRPHCVMYVNFKFAVDLL